MKKPTDDLEKLEGRYLPLWLKIVITIVSAAITVVVFYFLSGVFFNV